MMRTRIDRLKNNHDSPIMKRSTLQKMKRRSRNIKRLVIAVLVLVSMFAFVYWQNNVIVVTDLQIQNQKIPAAFDGYKIVQISDLHNKEFGTNQSKLVALVEESHPDMIVITGDIIDSSRTNIEVAMELVKRVTDIAPVYYVTGNHEQHSGVYPELKQQLLDADVKILPNLSIPIEKDGAQIRLIGVDDPKFSSKKEYKKQLANYPKKSDSEYRILLAHRPEYFEDYEANQMDLILSGHVHGGQVRLPFVGGVYAPDQGFFPKYSAGKYTMGDSTMVVNRGLGNSIFPVRVFNQPEIVVLTLRSE